MTKSKAKHATYKITFFVSLLIFIAVDFFISYGKSYKYFLISMAALLWIFYELYGMFFSGRWTAGYAMVDEKKGIGMQYVSLKWLFIPVYLAFAIGAALGGLWL